MAFLPSKRAGGIVGCHGHISCCVVLPGIQAKTSAYAASNLAMARLYEFLAVENPDLTIFTIQPGIVDTAMYRKSGMQLDSLLDSGECDKISSSRGQSDRAFSIVRETNLQSCLVGIKPSKTDKAVQYSFQRTLSYCWRALRLSF